jgi:multidrug resistance protein, MATE family
MSSESLPLDNQQSPSQRRPIAELLLLALPTVAQMASYTVMQFADRLMLSWMPVQGDLAAAAAGTAGITFFCFLGFGFGLLFVVNTMVSQNFGRGELAATGSSMWQGIWFGLAWGLVPIAMVPFAPWLFGLMGHEAAMVPLEADYFRVVTYGGPLKLATLAMAQFLLGLHRQNIVFVGTFVGMFANVFFNWLLIFGNWGFPALGVAGAAWGTNAAVLCELVVMTMYMARPRFVCEFGTNQWRLHLDQMRTLLKIGLPAGFQLICDITAWMIFMNVIVGAFGTTALAANSFAFTYMHLCFMPAFGVGGAVTALVGKYIGMKRHDVSMQRAHLGFFVCAVYMVAAGIGLGVFGRQLMDVFTDDPAVIEIGARILIFVAMYQIFDAMFLVYSSALRGAGDTLVPAVVQAVLVWSIVVGGGFGLIRWFPQFGVSGPWTVATVFGGILGLFLLTRFSRGRWKSIQLDLPTASNVAADSAKLADLTEVPRT